MPKFVCPECDQEMNADNEDVLTEQVKVHMSDQHDKENVSSDYISDNIEAHA